MTFENLLYGMPKLHNADTFCNWEFALSIAMKHVGCYDMMAGVVTRPDLDEADKDELADYNAKVADGLTAIGLTVDPSQYIHIHDCADGPAAWVALQGVYSRKSHAN